MSRKVMVFVPAYRGMQAAMVNALLRSLGPLQAAGVDIAFEITGGDSMICRARNNALAKFLASEADDIVMIDADVAWSEPDAVARLIGHDIDLIGGVYPHRCREPSWPVRLLDKPPLWQSGPVEVEGIPAGFMRISRACAEAVSRSVADRKYKDPRAPDGWAVPAFEFLTHSGETWGEDFVFCQRWRALGGTVWCEPDITFDHWGDQPTTGHFGHWLTIAAVKHMEIA